MAYQTLADMRTSVQNWLNETADQSRIDNAVNDAVTHLWQNLLTIDESTYLTMKPDLLTSGTDVIPFQDLGVLPFIEHWAVSHVYLSWYEYDAAAEWEPKAAGHLRMIMLEAKRKRGIQDTITPYDPYTFPKRRKNQ